jgi:hypothetical protein
LEVRKKMHVIGQWLVGIGALVGATGIGTAALIFFVSPECEEWRSVLLGLAAVVGIVMGLTFGMYQLGGDVLAAIR